MAVTHEDLAYRPRPHPDDVAGKRSVVLMVFALLLGFTGFILCLSAEATRSEVAWYVRSTPGVNATDTNQCYYTGSGRTPLTCAILAFLALAVAMFTTYAFVLAAVSGPRPPALVAWTLHRDPTAGAAQPSTDMAALTWRACILFVATWIVFAVAEVLLMVGIGVESGHLNGWGKMRGNCVEAGKGLFASAGVFELTTVFLLVGLYLTALKAQRVHQSEDRRQRHIRPVQPTTVAEVSGVPRDVSGRRQGEQQQLEAQPTAPPLPLSKMPPAPPV